ncbi:MAG: aminotransferase class V-fold PLP-dependent enzyme [Myxococcaceae bacterium]|nr:aminotransferase class V-fold PLP-dependent enzyme [Myxococcaceae bacterium]
MKHLFALDPDVIFLNHGSFGACPRVVLAEQQRLRDRLEAEPVRFFMREYEPMLDSARAALGRFLGCQADDLAFVTNATTAVNCVLRSQPFSPGDELLLTNHGYNACTNVARFVAERTGARVTVAPVPFPVTSPEQLVEAVLAAVTAKTKLALIDHVTSPTAIVFPIAPLVRALEDRGVRVLVDGAHSPGQTALALDTLGASYFTGNLHKWTCAPKGAAFLHVRRDLQAEIRPATISHGANAQRTDRSRFRVEFDWQGTHDPTPFLTVPFALDAVGALVPGGWDEVRQRGHTLVLEMRALVLEAVGGAPAVPDALIGMMATVPLPDAKTGQGALPGMGALDPLQNALWERHRIEVPIFTFEGRRCLRVSAHLHSCLDDARALAAALPSLL